MFSFDSEIRRLTPYTSNPNRLRGGVSGVVPYGTTCLFDAIVATARTVQDDAPRARAVVLLTDGIDTASLHSADDAATAAARLDLPVYVIGVGSLAGQAGSVGARTRARAPSACRISPAGPAASPATAPPPAQLSVLTQNILDELHHQYVMAFAAGAEQGWHPLQVRVRRGHVNARSRDGYYVR